MTENPVTNTVIIAATVSITIILHSALSNATIKINVIIVEKGILELMSVRKESGLMINWYCLY